MELNRNFSNQENQMARKKFELYTKSLVTGKMQIKSTLRFYLIPVRVAIIRNLQQMLMQI